MKIIKSAAAVMMACVIAVMCIGFTASAETANKNKIALVGDSYVAGMNGTDYSNNLVSGTSRYSLTGKLWTQCDELANLPKYGMTTSGLKKQLEDSSSTYAKSIEDADSVIVSIGAYDLLGDFYDAIDSGTLFFSSDEEYCEETYGKLLKETESHDFTTIENNIKDSLAAIKKLNPTADIYITTLWNPLESFDEIAEDNYGDCDYMKTFTEGYDAAWGKLNNAIKDAANSEGVHLVNLASSFKGYVNDYTSIASTDLHLDFNCNANAKGVDVILGALKRAGLKLSSTNTTVEDWLLFRTEYSDIANWVKDCPKAELGDGRQKALIETVDMSGETKSDIVSYCYMGGNDGFELVAEAYDKNGKLIYTETAESDVVSDGSSKVVFAKLTTDVGSNLGSVDSYKIFTVGKFDDTSVFTSAVVTSDDITDDDDVTVLKTAFMDLSTAEEPTGTTGGTNKAPSIPTDKLSKRTIDTIPADNIIEVAKLDGETINQVTSKFVLGYVDINTGDKDSFQVRIAAEDNAGNAVYSQPFTPEVSSTADGKYSYCDILFNLDELKIASNDIKEVRLEVVVKDKDELLGKEMSYGFATQMIAKPTFAPSSGSLVKPGEKITISHSENDVKIYYTTDGTDPTEKSTEYTAPFEITANTTVKAIAVKDGKYYSDIAEANYIYDGPGYIEGTVDKDGNYIATNGEYIAAGDDDGYIVTDGTDYVAGTNDGSYTEYGSLYDYAPSTGDNVLFISIAAASASAAALAAIAIVIVVKRKNKK